jgi:diguanylate cyclase (GGDEF)-like protein
MLVNRVDTHEAPYKILSCPVVGQEGTANGLLALFRAAERPNFEMDDVRLIEFASRQAMALLCERQDSLTGLMSRTAFERQLDEGMTASFRAPPGSLLYLDVEALKAINEAFGFAIGDEVILRTAQLIRRSLTPNESACRLSGDRFIVHLPERNGEEASILAAEIARSANDLGYTAGKRKVPLGLRYGVAAAPSKTGGARHWIAAAERACQQARTDR